LPADPNEGGGGGGFLNGAAVIEDGERDDGGATRIIEDADEVVAFDTDRPNDVPAAPGLRARLL